MIEKYKPDMYMKNIYEIDYKKLKNMGIKCILLDLDNTLVPFNVKFPSRKIKDIIERIKDKGFKVIIFSNSSKSRLKPFKDKLEVDCAYSCRKPSTYKFKKILNLYKYNESQVAIIGDQLVADILGGNKCGIYTILVDPIQKKEFIFTKFNRMIEKVIYKKFKNKNILKKGNYYES